MKILALALALVLAVVATLTVWGSLGSRARPAPVDVAASAPSAAADDGRVTRLERRVDELAAEIAGLRGELDRLASERRVPAGVEPRAAAPAPAPAGVEPTPQWYLEQYVASFGGNGQGSEYFRLAVEAFAPALLQEIGALVLDARSHPALRLRLLEMLGDPRFARHERALAILLRVLSASAEETLLKAALAAIGRNGDLLTARAVERMVWSLPGGFVRWQALGVLVELSGADGNAAVLRLFPAAGDEATRAVLLSLLQPKEWPAALAVFEQASLQSKNVRLEAADAIGRFRFPEVQAFVEAWIARESDPDVRAALGAARTALSQVPPWSASRATGPPDANPADDDQNAWASAEPDMGEQWLELSYDPPMKASAVRIFEVCVAGCVARITGIDERGGAHELWAGDDPTLEPGPFEVTFPATAFRVSALRITLDTNRRPGWSEIDAVELIGPSGRAWASAAAASSSYGK